jgi:RimJ/RimL family protein N-acetyltransferase
VPYPLATDRLLIEPIVAADIDAFLAYRRDPAIARWQSWEPSYDDADFAALIARQPVADLPAPGGWIQLAIRDLARQVLYGDVAVHTVSSQPGTYEIGITLATAAQGQGIGTEAVARVLNHLFTDAAAHRVIAFCDSRNSAVARLLDRVGMRRESRQVDADYFKGEWTTLDGYAVLAAELREAPPG